MSCQPFNFGPGGGQGFICGGPRTRRCTVPGCTGPATALCDEPLVGVPGKRTCSRAMCEQHRTRTTTGIDLCPPHASAREGAAAAPQPGHLRLVSHTVVVNLRRAPYDVYIGRAGHGQDGYFGNPFRVEQHGQAALDMYRRHFAERVEKDAEFRRRVLGLRGKRLGCFCAPRACHGDVIAAWVDAQPVAP